MKLEPLQALAACPLGGICGGCPWISRPLQTQGADKMRALERQWAAAGLGAVPWSQAGLHHVGAHGLRDVAELSFRLGPGASLLGLYDLWGNALVDMPDCPALSPPLRAWLTALRTSLPPVDKATLRLRVAPDGTRGLWLDLANDKAKALLDESSWISSWLERGVVIEMGQRRKPLSPGAPRPKLGKHPILRPWFETPGPANPIALYGTIASFSQPSLIGNRALVTLVIAATGASIEEHWLEVGAGSGNFTLAMAARGMSVTAVELDPLACDALERGAAQASLADRVRVHRTPMAALAPIDEAIDGLLVDPPRSGLGGFVNVLAAWAPERRPKRLVYVSCHGESMTQDFKALRSVGYIPNRVSGVDQFPQTPHAEWIVSADLS